MKPKTEWSVTQLLMVMNATASSDRCRNASCPVCGKDTLDFDRQDMFRCVAWCRTCETGMKQGDSGVDGG